MKYFGDVECEADVDLYSNANLIYNVRLILLTPSTFNMASKYDLIEITTLVNNNI